MQVKPETDTVQLLLYDDEASFDLELPAVSVSVYEVSAVEQEIIGPANLLVVS